jgi:membrane protease YdiL (CAAX protease family)
MGGLGTRVRALSARAELLIVVVLAFAWFVYASLSVVLDMVSGATPPPETETELIEIVAFESVILVVLGWFLFVRGWTIADLGLNPTWGDGRYGLALGIVVRAMQGLGLALVASFAYQFAVAAFWDLLRRKGFATDASAFPSELSAATLLGILVINSIYEEVFLCGYLISRLSKTRGVWFAINVSTAIRLSYHLYQGAEGVLSIITLGLIFGFWFVRTRQLWPLIFAHGYINFLVWVVGQ